MISIALEWLWIMGEVKNHSTEEDTMARKNVKKSRSASIAERKEVIVIAETQLHELVEALGRAERKE
jgi:hypothetical protein